MFIIDKKKTRYYSKKNWKKNNVRHQYVDIPSGQSKIPSFLRQLELYHG